MSSLPTPNWITTEDYSFYHDGHSSKVLPSGSFARPLNIQYVPKHVTDKESPWNRHDPAVNVYCYTSYGTLLLKWDILRKV